jgi:hypothetical protein
LERRSPEKEKNMGDDYIIVSGKRYIIKSES